MENKKKTCLIAAGGTGGHIFAAKAIGEEASDYQVQYVSGQRPLDYKLFQGHHAIHMPARGIAGKNLLTIFKALILNFYVFIRTFILVLFNRPEFIIGAGGYICGPALMAGYVLRVPIFILEQNSVVGITNKLLAKYANKIFINFSQTKKYFLDEKVIQSGNPIRSDFYTRNFINPEMKNELNILVFGGSLGALEINKLVESFLKDAPSIGFKVNIMHQVGIGKDDLSINDFNNEKFSYQKKDFIDDMAEAYTWCDLVIARSGASTVSEVKVVAKPAIFLPLLIHKDKQQVHNANFLKEEADFPIFIEESENLAQNNYSNLVSIIHSAKDWKDQADRSTKKVLNSAKVIVNEVEKYVQK